VKGKFITRVFECKIPVNALWSGSLCPQGAGGEDLYSHLALLNDRSALLQIWQNSLKRHENLLKIMTAYDFYVAHTLILSSIWVSHFLYTSCAQPAGVISAAGESCRTELTLPHRKEWQFFEFINFAHKLESRNIYGFPNTEWEHTMLEPLTPDSGGSEKIAEWYVPPSLYSFTYQLS